MTESLSSRKRSSASSSSRKRSSASQHTIAGTVLTMPVNVRKATQHTAMFAVDADATQRMIHYSGLQVYRPLPGTSDCDVDTDAFRRQRSRRVLRVQHLRERQSSGIEAQHSFPAIRIRSSTCSSTKGSPWRPADDLGLPKVMADYTIRDGKQFGFDASIDGQLVIGMEFLPGLKVPACVAKAGVVLVLVPRRRPAREPVRDVPSGRALPAGRCAVAARESSLRKRTRVAGPAETRTGFDFVRERCDDVRRRQEIS